MKITRHIPQYSSLKLFSQIFKHLFYRCKLGQCTIFFIFPVLRILCIPVGHTSQKCRCSQVKRKQSVFSAQGSLLYFQRDQEVKNQPNKNNYQKLPSERQEIYRHLLFFLSSGVKTCFLFLLHVVSTRNVNANWKC